MEESGGPPKLSSFAPLLSIIPAAWLAFMSRAVFCTYENGLHSIDRYGRNIFEPLLIGGVVWAVAAGALAAMLFIEAVFRLYGKGYDIPSVAVALAGAWNLLLGFVGFAGNPFPCGLFAHIAPERVFPGALYLTAITFGLLLAGIGAIKHESFKGSPGTLVKVMCLMNGIAAAQGTILVWITCA